MSIGIRDKRWRALALLLALGLIAAACGDDDDTAAADERGSLNLGYFPNVTHAPAILGVL